MATETQRASATIYAFPARGRFAVAQDETTANPASVRSPKVVTVGAWYHDEAIKEADRARQN